MIKCSNILSLLFVTLISFANNNEIHNIEKQSTEKHPKQMALINELSFHTEKFNKNNAGNGFIVTVKGDDYAITAKHILMIAKTDKMAFVDFAGELKQWKMFDKNNTSRYLIIDQLLNTDKTEKLDWETLKNDWLVLSIKENKTDYPPLKFRKTSLIKGEKLYVVGWTYQDKQGPQKTHAFEFQETKEGMHTLIQIRGPEKLAGLSGSPVVDAHNRVIGLVATGWQDEKTKVTYLQASIGSDIHDYILNISKK